jgi:OTU domain-containing protein 6
MEKEIVGKITGLKKMQKASSKERKKEILIEIAGLEEELKALKLQRETKKVLLSDSNTAIDSSINTKDDITVIDSSSNTKDDITVIDSSSNTKDDTTVIVTGSISRDGSRNESRKKKKKRNILVEYEETRQRALLEQDDSINYKEMEEMKLIPLLRQDNLKIYLIPADGHCLYNSIAHQLNTRISQDYISNIIENNILYASLEHKDGTNSGFDYKELRRIASIYMKNHSNDFIPFMQDSQPFDSYCNQVENGAIWGGQMEIQAISQSFELKIIIYQSDMKIVIGEEFSEFITISYHKYQYGLGEHYNSLIDII